MTLQVRAGRRTRRYDSIGSVYSVRGGVLLRRSLRDVAGQSTRLGRSSARLDLGQHWWAGLAHDLGMSVRPTIGLTQADGLETMVRFDRLGMAGQRAEAPADPDPVQAPFVIRDEGGSEAIVDQQLDRLPFHAAGRFEPA